MAGNIDVREIWLNYFNNTLYEQKLISKSEHDKMAHLIRKKCHTSPQVCKRKNIISVFDDSTKMHSTQ